MKATFEKIESMGFGWNQHQLSEEDFYRLCKKHKVKVSELPIRRRGYYTRSGKKDHIVIKKGMTEFQTLFVMFHEFGHFLMHGPGIGQEAKFSGYSSNAKEEYEADAFALCALLPLTLLSSVPVEELYTEYRYPTRFLTERLKIYEREGI